MTTPAAGLPPANWYPDPQTPGQLRYWDGQRWTQHVHPGQGAQAGAPAEADAAGAGASAGAVVGAQNPGAGVFSGAQRGQTVGAATGAATTFRPGGRPGEVPMPRTPGPDDGPPEEPPGHDPRTLQHWILPRGRSVEAIIAGFVAIFATIVTAASVYGFDPSYDAYITYVALGLSFLSVLMGISGLRRAEEAGYHGKARSWFAVMIGFIMLLLNAFELMYPDELIGILLGD